MRFLSTSSILLCGTYDDLFLSSMPFDAYYNIISPSPSTQCIRLLLAAPAAASPQSPSSLPTTGTRLRDIIVMITFQYLLKSARALTPPKSNLHSSRGRTLSWRMLLQQFHRRTSRFFYVFFLRLHCWSGQGKSSLVRPGRRIKISLAWTLSVMMKMIEMDYRRDAKSFITITCHPLLRRYPMRTLFSRNN